ncbi:MAG: hypothetical protein FJ083_07760 [Cyanobacteria bacterium K_Offshore_surface_m2_239]|nr:hypothetical protein [Cyanobacteria bacterium K_Offshore_surface_m2_239]
MEGTAFSIEEASFDASLLPEGSRTAGSEAFHRAVTDDFQPSHAGLARRAPTPSARRCWLGIAPIKENWPSIERSWQRIEGSSPRIEVG